MTSPVSPASGTPSLALLVLGGSSGRVEERRAHLLAGHGIAALAMPWFGVPGLPSTPRRVPLESFLPHLDRLADLAPRIGVLGTSFGAEAALLLAVRDPRIALVAALAPTSVVWQTPDLDDLDRPIDDAKWTWRGERLLGVPYVDQAGHDLPDARSVHEASLTACPDPAAYAIPVEEITGEVLVSAGGDDRVWPAQRFCEEIVGRRRRAAGRETTYVFHRDAGHRLVLPGEEPAPDRPGFPPGGTPEADAEHGRAVLAALLAHQIRQVQ